MAFRAPIRVCFSDIDNAGIGGDDPLILWEHKGGYPFDTPVPQPYIKVNCYCSQRTHQYT